MAGLKVLPIGCPVAPWVLGHTVAGVQIGERPVAKAQEASAGLMLQFAKAVDPVPPTFTLVDGNGKAVEDGGTITTDEVTVSAVDPVDAAKCPVPSGFYRIVVRNVGTGVDMGKKHDGIQLGYGWMDTQLRTWESA